jgi:RNA-splicing ligase RtcB
MKNADPDKVSTTAKNRGLTQVGTLGSGNHFLEIQKVDRIYDSKTAKIFGIEHEGQVTVMIHCGSRGFGHQTCSDYLRVMERAVHKYKITLPDRELACAPGNSNEAEDYYQAMACAVNYAFANRQAIMHWIRQSAGRMLSRSAAKRRFWGGDVKKALEQRGIIVRSASSVVLAEEADPAYKNVDMVVDVSDKVGIATKVARVVPLAVVKG